MNKNLNDYLKIYSNFLDPTICKQSLKELKAANFTTHSYYDVNADLHKSFSTDLSVSMDILSTNDYLMQRTWDAVHQYIIQDLKLEWFSSWAGYMQLRYNKYSPGTEMRLHCDHIHSLFDGQRKGVPILTILGILNDNYKGGELVMFEDEILETKAGDVLVFPSNFLYPHKVNPVTKGTRYSFVSWTW